MKPTNLLNNLFSTTKSDTCAHLTPQNLPNNQLLKQVISDENLADALTWLRKSNSKPDKDANKKRIGQYWKRWLVWGLGFSFSFVSLASGAAVCAPANLIDDGDNGVSGVFGAPDGLCFSTGGLHPSYVTTNEPSAFQIGFFVALPDSDPTGTARSYMYSTDAAIPSIEHTTTCPGASISTTDNVNSISLDDQTNCILTVSGPSGTAGATVTYTATLSRAGDLYSLSAGTVVGAPFNATPVSAPLNSTPSLLMGLGGIGLAGLGYSFYRRERNRATV